MEIFDSLFDLAPLSIITFIAFCVYVLAGLIGGVLVCMRRRRHPLRTRQPTMMIAFSFLSTLGTLGLLSPVFTMGGFRPRLEASFYENRADNITDEVFNEMEYDAIHALSFRTETRHLWWWQLSLIMCFTVCANFYVLRLVRMIVRFNRSRSLAASHKVMMAHMFDRRVSALQSHRSASETGSQAESNRGSPTAIKGDSKRSSGTFTGIDASGGATAGAERDGCLRRSLLFLFDRHGVKLYFALLFVETPILFFTLVAIDPWLLGLWGESEFVHRSAQTFFMLGVGFFYAIVIVAIAVKLRKVKDTAYMKKEALFVGVTAIVCMCAFIVARTLDDLGHYIIVVTPLLFTALIASIVVPLYHTTALFRRRRNAKVRAKFVELRKKGAARRGVKTLARSGGGGAAQRRKLNRSGKRKVPETGTGTGDEQARASDADSKETPADGDEGGDEDASTFSLSVAVVEARRAQTDELLDMQFAVLREHGDDSVAVTSADVKASGKAGGNFNAAQSHLLLMQMLDSTVLRDALSEFCVADGQVEHLNAFGDLTHFTSMFKEKDANTDEAAREVDDAERVRGAKQFLRSYLLAGKSPHYLDSLPPALAKRSADVYSKVSGGEFGVPVLLDIIEPLFTDLHDHVLSVLGTDVVPRFLESEIYLEAVERMFAWEDEDMDIDDDDEGGDDYGGGKGWGAGGANGHADGRSRHGSGSKDSPYAKLPTFGDEKKVYDELPTELLSPRSKRKRRQTRLITRAEMSPRSGSASHRSSHASHRSMRSPQRSLRSPRRSLRSPRAGFSPRRRSSSLHGTPPLTPKRRRSSYRSSSEQSDLGASARESRRPSGLDAVAVMAVIAEGAENAPNEIPATQTDMEAEAADTVTDATGSVSAVTAVSGVSPPHIV